MNFLKGAFLLSMLLNGHSATSILGIVSDWNGFFDSYQGALNSSAIRPNSMHNLVAFESGGTLYSTGVNDSILDANQSSKTNAPFIYSTGNYRALTPSLAESRLVGQGSADDGDSGSFSNGGQVYPTPATANSYNVTPYLVDGIKGLGLSTFANNVGGTFSFNLSNVDGSTVGDGIPDLIYFNMAAPSRSAIQFEFFDSNSISLGSTGSVENSHPAIARIQNDRINVNTGNSTAAASNQNVQGFSVEFSDIPGMTQAILENATRLDVILPPQADPPFIAFNEDAFKPEPIPVPEPNSSLLLLLSVLGVASLRRRNH